jgi:hypothetical protein
MRKKNHNNSSLLSRAVAYFSRTRFHHQHQPQGDHGVGDIAAARCRIHLGDNVPPRRSVAEVLRHMPDDLAHVVERPQRRDAGDGERAGGSRRDQSRRFAILAAGVRLSDLSQYKSDEDCEKHEVGRDL